MDQHFPHIWQVLTHFLNQNRLCFRTGQFEYNMRSLVTICSASLKKAE